MPKEECQETIILVIILQEGGGVDVKRFGLSEMGRNLRLQTLVVVTLSGTSRLLVGLTFLSIYTENAMSQRYRGAPR
ncbi:hypothetical protein D8674_004306 [Pyrus ussuriensis x Pyrus communis]|uniref:Uncharacterized protein n=1 Tax=Pyrus ussuriensis x Pyrus communis TaxID=2448454 RepID=A0A5N5FNR9_9ROSA|nr:hypothetical protein D8674_004306 [Pyrus ussuriensis x Pyrus communis]